VTLTSEEKYLGKSIENILREALEKEFSRDPETLNLAIKLLETYKVRGSRGVKELLYSLVEQYGSSLKGA